eukprot:365471-Chlamydomonas_euryale.AAC.19
MQWRRPRLPRLTGAPGLERGPTSTQLRAKGPEGVPHRGLRASLTGASAFRAEKDGPAVDSEGFEGCSTIPICFPFGWKPVWGQVPKLLPLCWERSAPCRTARAWSGSGHTASCRKGKLSWPHLRQG